MEKYLREIIYHGSFYEKERAMLMLWDLCFDEQVAANVANDQQFANYLLMLQNDQKLENLSKYAAGTLLEVKVIEKEVNKVVHGAKEHVMLSFEKNGHQLASHICADLERINYTTWAEFDVSRQKINTAIENSICVIVFVSVWYKYSPECRTEIEHALALNKPILVVIVDKEYKPTGW